MPKRPTVFAANEAATTERTATHVRLTANVAGPGRTETLMGRAYRVVPATLVREQVLHNNLGATYLAAEDITPDWAEMANGAPVIIDHPTRNGQPITAREPSVLNERGVGALYRTRAQNGVLKADVYLAEDLAESVDGLKAILEKLDQGQTVELSTGFPAVGEEVEGEFEGTAYNLRLYPTGFDHLAVFADKVGACSVNDGCGLGVLNEDATAGVASRIWAHLKALVTEQQDDTQAGHDMGLAIHQPPEEGENMKRSELIAALCACDKVAFRRETLEAMDDKELAHVANEAEVGAEPAEEKPGAEAAVEPVEETETEAPEGEAAENEKVPAWARALQREVAQLREATEPARNEQAAERKRLTSDIVANTDLEEADLKSEPLAKLQKLHRATCNAKPQTYVGLGLPRRSDPSTRSVDLGFEVRSTLTPKTEEA